jgi:hypothetical protein
VTALVALLVLAPLVLVVTLTHGPPMVGAVTVVNTSRAPVTVEVSDGDDSSVLPLGTVDVRSRLRFAQVLDQGDRWRFRYSVGPDQVGAVDLSRDELEQAGWEVTVAPDVADALPDDRR